MHQIEASIPVIMQKIDQNNSQIINMNLQFILQVVPPKNLSSHPSGWLFLLPSCKYYAKLHNVNIHIVSECHFQHHSKGEANEM